MRLDQRAADDVLAELLGIAGPRATSRLTGVAAAGGWAATDDDRSTSWITPFGGAVGAALELTVPEGVDAFDISQPQGDYSPITALRLSTGDESLDVPVPPADADGVSHVSLARNISGDVTVEITEVEPQLTLDRRYAEPVVVPAAISELSIGERTAIPASVDTACRDDLVQIDGEPLSIRIEASSAQLLAGDAVEATPCASAPLDLAAGTHRLITTNGTSTGLDVDRVVLRDTAVAPADAAGSPSVTLESQERLSRRVTVDNCPDGCWLVLGEGFHESWSARTEAGDLGAPQLVDGGFNGWWIPPSDEPTEVSLRWTAQTPLNVALVLTMLAVLACIAVAVLDRRRRAVPATVPAARASPPVSPRCRCEPAGSSPSCGSSPPPCSSDGRGRWSPRPPPCSSSAWAGPAWPAW